MNTLRAFPIVVLVCVMVLTGCSSNNTVTQVNEAGTGLPAALPQTGSTVTYMDTVISNGKITATIATTDSVVVSGSAIYGRNNTLQLQSTSGAGMLLVITRYMTETLHSGDSQRIVNSKVYQTMPSVYAVDSNGDFVAPGYSLARLVVDSTNTVVTTDTHYVWFDYPTHTKKHYVIISPVSSDTTDEFIPQDAVHIHTPDESIFCEHTVRKFYNYDLNHRRSIYTFDVFFSPALNVPVIITMRVTNASGQEIGYHSRYLLSHRLH